MKTIYILDFFGVFNKEMAKALTHDQILTQENMKDFMREPQKLAEILQKIKRNMGSVAIMFNLASITDVNAAEEVVDDYMAKLNNPTDYRFFSYSFSDDVTSYSDLFNTILKSYFPILAKTNALHGDKLPVERIVVVSGDKLILDAANGYKLKTIKVESNNSGYIELFSQTVETLSLSDDDEKNSINNELVKEKAKIKDRRESAAHVVYRELAPLDKQEFIAACKLEMIGRWRKFVMELSKSENYEVAEANADYEKVYNACVDDCIENYRVKLDSRDYIFVGSSFVKLDKSMRQELVLNFITEIANVFERYRKFRFQPNENFITLISNIEGAYQHQNKQWQELQDRKDQLNSEFVDHMEMAKQNLATIDTERKKVSSSDMRSNMLEQYCREGDLENIKLYLQKNIPFYKNQSEALEKPLNSKGDTLLHLVCFYGHLNVIKWLIEEKKMDIFLRNFDGYMIYHSVFNSKNITTINYVISLFKSKELCLKTNRGQSILHLAEEKGLSDIVKQLLEKQKIPPNLLDKNAETVLHYAVKANDTDLVVWLLDSTNINTRQRNSDANTALYIAFLNTNQEMITHFRARGIWLATDEFDRLADYAKKNNKPEIIQNLAKYLNEDIKQLETIWGKLLPESNSKQQIATSSTTLFLAKTTGKDLAASALIEMPDDELVDVDMSNSSSTSSFKFN